MCRVLIIVLLLSTACTNKGVVSRCREICARESQCAQEVDVEMDRAECVAQCASLERKQSAQQLVKKHMNCVDSAGDCSAVLDCP